MISERDMMHGRDWAGENLAGWLLSEKLRGCRAYWDGSEMWTRGGNRVAIPAHWREALPAQQLDGEIFAGRDGEQIASVAVRCGRFTPECRFHVFDVPALDAGWLECLDAARVLLAGLDFTPVVTAHVCQGTAAAFAELAGIQTIGGEGLVARAPGHRYQPGRSARVLKLKDMAAPLVWCPDLLDLAA
jgi:DNA ligase-1